MASTEKDANSCTVNQLKTILREKGLSTAGAKTELIARLFEKDPAGGWMSQAPSGSEETRERQDENGGEIGEASANDTMVESLRREMELCRREKRLMERELQLMRRENDLLRRTQNANGDGEVAREETTVRSLTTSHESGAININAIAELLGYFEGDGGTFEPWVKRVGSLRSAYHLTDDLTRILIGARLKGKAQEWFHSDSRYAEITVDELLLELRNMFFHETGRVHMRKQFERRIWRREEAFSEYFHQKVILGNRLKIEEEEMLEYIIEGIPDPVLKDQARVQRLRTRKALLEAFERISLRGREQPGSRDGVRSRRAQGRAEREDAGATRGTTMRCHNCGAQGHRAADCPSRAKGTRCFECKEFGHIAANCVKKKSKINEVKNTCVIARAERKYFKDIKINNEDLVALIDTGSDLSLIREDRYVKIGSPSLTHREIVFRGIGTQNFKIKGQFNVEIKIDDEYFLTSLSIVPNELLQCDLILGTDLINKVNLSVEEGKITIRKPHAEVQTTNDLPEIFKIEVADEHNDIDLTNLTSEQKNDVREIISRYNPTQKSETDYKMTIILRDDEPVYQRPRRLSPSEKERVSAHVNEWLAAGIIQPSLSDYASPVVLVKKKTGETRLCVDYRQLNKKIIKDRYPLPLIDDQVDALQGASIFSTIDLRNGFFHVPIERESRKYTAFVVPDGQYEFLYAPFGLCNSPAVFQRFINQIFRELINNGVVLTYVDDRIIPSSSCKAALSGLEKVLSIAGKFGLNINWKKCKFLQTRVEFLGLIIENGTTRPSKHKTEAVTKFPHPKTVKQVQSFLGLTGYFRKFVKNYALIAKPLSDLLKINTKFEFGVKEKEAFDKLKFILSEKPVLRLYKQKAETELHTDASKYGFGAILLQKCDDDGALHPIYYASGKTTDAEAKYTSYELETLAIMKALRKFRIYLLGINFKIVTDCQAFALTMNKKDLCVRVARWALSLEEFSYSIVHRPGKNMIHVDTLSRSPLPHCMLINESEESLVARIRKAQREDVNLRGIYALANRGQKDGYIVRGGLLYKEDKGDLQVIVPKCLQAQVARHAHENGHFAAEKTEALIKRNYWFPNMRSVVENVVRNCVNCILANKRAGKLDGYLNPIAKGHVPLETYHIDHLGPLPSTKKRYQHILVVVEAFSKFVWLFGTRSTGTSEVIDKLNKLAVNFGNPRRIISDRGTAFTSNEFREYCEKEKIKHVLITTGVPRANGQVERINRTLIPVLTKLTAPRPDEWYKYLDQTQQYLNAVPSRSTGKTPFQLMFGTHMRLRDNPKLRELIEEEIEAMFSVDRDELREQARECIMRTQNENKRNYNKRREKAKRYREDDLVAIKRTQAGPGLKCAAKFLGPYQIIKVLRNDRYIVRKIGDHKGPSETSTASDHIKPWLENDDSYDDDDDNNQDEI